MTLTIEEIENLTKEMEEESKAIKRDIFRMAWYMRGALSIEEAYQLDIIDREVISDLIKENLDTTKETKLPFF